MKINKVTSTAVLIWFGIPFIYMPAFGVEITWLNLIACWYFVNLYMVCPIVLILGFFGGAIYSLITLEEREEWI